MRIRAALIAVGLVLAAPAAGAEIDYSELTFPRDARNLIDDADAYNDALEYHEDKVEAAVKRLYAAVFLANIIESCSEGGFWTELKNLPTTAGAYLNEIRADKDLDTALPHARHIRETLKHGARSLGMSDSSALVAQGICEEIKP